MNSLFINRTIVLIFTILFLSFFTFATCPQVMADSWMDDFEGYTAGQFPAANWTYSGNSDILVDDTTYVSGNQSVRMFGLLDSCWGGRGR